MLEIKYSTKTEFIFVLSLVYDKYDVIVEERIKEIL